MNILFISKYYWPHVGGVEKHVREVAESLVRKGNKVTIISEKDIKYPHVKFLGLLYIWFWLLKNRRLIEESDIVHVHDVFIWYLPFRFLYYNKLIYMTFHGGQDIWPIPWKHIFYVRLAAKLSRGTIAIGDFIGKYFGIKPDFVSYGGVSMLLQTNVPKERKSVIFLGRLERATGVREFIKRIKKYKGCKIDFVGDGSLRKQCSKYGKVHGFTDPTPFLQRTEICFAGGYLAALEALAYKCRLWIGWDTTLKKDYWQLSLFYKWANSERTEEAYKWVTTQTWEAVSGIYLKLWGKK